MLWAISHDRTEQAIHGSGPVCTGLPPACSISSLRGVSSLEAKRVPDTHPVHKGLTLPRESGLRRIRGGVTPHVDDGKERRSSHDL